LPFPIDFDGRPYNTLTLPCERVMSVEGSDPQSQEGKNVRKSRTPIWMVCRR